MMMAIFFDCTFPPLLEIRENPEFHDLMRKDRGIGLDVCFGTVGSPCFLVLLVPLLGQSVLLRVLVTLLKLRLDATHLV